jgi:hypothetical protein
MYLSSTLLACHTNYQGPNVVTDDWTGDAPLSHEHLVDLWISHYHTCPTSVKQSNWVALIMCPPSWVDPTLCNLSLSQLCGVPLNYILKGGILVGEGKVTSHNT